MTRRLTALDAVVDALAVYRLTRLAQRDEVWPVREAREIYETVTSESRWRDLADCPWCLSMWVAAGVVFARWRWPRAWRVLSRILAGSAAAGLLTKIEDL